MRQDAASSTSTEAFVTQLERARAAGVLRFDLTEADPARCGIGWDARELEMLLDTARGLPISSYHAALAVAREAVASYLAGHGVAANPDRIFFAPSRAAARRRALDAVCRSGDDVLVPAPGRPLLDAERGIRSLRQRAYAVEFEGLWRLDRRSVRNALGPRAQAIVVGNPAEPSGATLAHDELAFLEELCGARDVALVGDEAYLDLALGPAFSVGRAKGCLALHVSGLTGVCGLPRLGAEWIAVTGPDALAAPVASGLGAGAELPRPVEEEALRAIPALLARREPFLARVRARLARNRGLVASAALREAPWSLQWGAGPWAVLQINPFRDATALCLALLDAGVAVQPGALDGLPGGHLVVSLLPDPATFQAGLDRLEAQLRSAAP